MLTRRMNPKVAVSVALPAISRDLSVPLDRVDGSRSTAAAENHQNHVMSAHQVADEARYYLERRAR